MSSLQYEHYKFVADKGQKPLRVDKFLLNFIEFATRNKIQNAIKLGHVKVNNIVVKSNHKVKSNDIVTVVYDKPKETYELVAQNIPINIEYEDNDIIIINKDAGMVVHPGHGNRQNTLVNALTYHFKNLPIAENKERPGLVHRIDKNTSGLLVVAKNQSSMSILSKKFYDRKIDRRYIALVWGDLENDKGTISGNIGRHPKNRKIMTVFSNSENGKKAISHYRVLERFHYTTLIECKLDTGRTHQIRAHFQHIGHPLFNDFEYGGAKVLRGTVFAKYKQFVLNCFKICTGQALHAKSLKFSHPITNKKLKFDSEPPNDFKKLIDKWRKYSINQNTNS